MRPILTLSITPFTIFGIFPLLFPNIFKYFHKFPFLGSLISLRKSIYFSLSLTNIIIFSPDPVLTGPTWVTIFWKQWVFWLMWRAHPKDCSSFWVEGGDIDKSYVHCRLCLVKGGSACRGRVSPRTTWSFECMFVWFYDKMTINHGTHDDCFKTELFSWWYICINRICINRRLIGAAF